MPRGTIKATVLIETILAAFEMDEILYELREHSAGLNCGRWDYIFSFIKKFANDPNVVLPDRAQVTMTTHFLRAYAQLLIKTCHRAARTRWAAWRRRSRSRTIRPPTRRRWTRSRADKTREATDGHDGTWVAHPGLVPIAKDDLRPAHAAGRIRSRASAQDVNVDAADLLQVPQGPITETGLRQNINVGISISRRGCAGWAACRSTI